MAGRPPYGQPHPNPLNPFSNPGPAPYSQLGRQQSADSLTGDVYASGNGSNVHLTGPQGYYGQPAQSADDVSDYEHYAASVDSHISTSSAGYGQNPFSDIPGSKEPYPAWTAERQVPISAEEIEDIFLDLAQKFGFQKDSMRNMVRCRCD